MEDEEKPRRKAAWGWLSLAKTSLVHPHQMGARQQYLLKLDDASISCNMFGWCLPHHSWILVCYGDASRNGCFAAKSYGLAMLF